MNASSLTRVAILSIALPLAQMRLSAAGEPLALRVTPTAAVGHATIRLRVLVEHDAMNRLLELTADSGDFYQASSIQLDGEEAPKINEVVFRDMPQGTYEIVVRLLDPEGRVRAMARGTVVIIAP